MPYTFASRAGQKLEHALTTFKIDLSDMVCADFGCSTGGFTDCMLKNGASKVYSVDTGYGVLDWNLRNNPNVVVMERTNALHVSFPEQIDFITIDVSWTKQRLIIPSALRSLKEDGEIVTLIKPHYEANKEWVRSGRILDEYISPTLEKVATDIKQLKMKILGQVESPILGKKGGNPEYLFWLRRV